MRTFLSLLLGLSLSGTLLALALLALRRLVSARLPSAFYYYAWLLVLLRFVLPLPGLMPGFARTASPVPVPASLSAVSFEGGPRSYSDDFYHAGAGTETEGATLSPVPVENPLPVGESADAAFPSPAAQGLFDFGQALRSPRFWLSVWGIGAVLSALWYVGAYFRFRRELLASAKEARAEDLAVYSLVAGEPCPRLCRSRAVRTPLLLGVLRPVIFLPDRDYSPAMLRGVLAHELTHHRRGDVLVKWFSVLVSVLHWFNPVTILLRGELDRACELACDERLLRRMDAGEKQLYGDMLLTLAADRRMPRSVVATSFAVEKRNLKERLYQIMTYKKRGRAALCLALAAMLLLSACGAVVGPRAVQSSQTLAAAAVPTEAPREENTEPVPTPEPPGTFKEVTVDNIDDFLEAIAPNTMIFLKPGVYDLSAAASYGGDTGNEYCRWDDALEWLRRVPLAYYNGKGYAPYAALRSWDIEPWIQRQWLKDDVVYGDGRWTLKANPKVTFATLMRQLESTAALLAVKARCQRSYDLAIRYAQASFRGDCWFLMRDGKSVTDTVRCHETDFGAKALALLAEAARSSDATLRQRALFARCYGELHPSWWYRKEWNDKTIDYDLLPDSRSSQYQAFAALDAYVRQQPAATYVSRCDEYQQWKKLKK